jgi:thiol-disulfide isomerase/thioredoxin
MTPKTMRILREAAIFIFAVWMGSMIISYIRAPRLDSGILPHITGTLTNGKHLDSDQLISKPLMIEFWGTWCPVCNQQAPNVASIAKKYNVIAIAVNSRSNEHINTWLKEHNVAYPVLNDPSGKWADRFKVTVYPTTFFYDSTGRLKFTEVGYTTTAGMLARMKISE